MPTKCYECEQELKPGEPTVEVLDVTVGDDGALEPGKTYVPRVVHVVACLAKTAALLEEDAKAGRW